jgi:hypothetical protein
MLTAVDFDDHALFKANKVENKVLKRDLPTKFEAREPPIAEQTPHGGLSVGRFTADFLWEIADAFGGWPMVWRLQHEPLTRRYAPPSSQGEKEENSPAMTTSEGSSHPHRHQNVQRALVVFVLHQGRRAGIGEFQDRDLAFDLGGDVQEVA